MTDSKIKAGVIAVSLILVLSNISCGFSPGGMQPVNDTANGIKVHGHVTDENGKPIPGADIYVSDINYQPLSKTTADSSGYYQVFLTASSTYHLYTGVLSQIDKYNFAYIPQSRGIIPRADSDSTIDFKLRPGATIVLYAYDNDGNLIRNKQFRALTGANDFATALNNLPEYSFFTAINDSISNWQWDQAIPAFVVEPQSAYKFEVNWEVPGFGKVILNIDNECKGYICNTQAEKLELNFNYEAAKSKLTALRNDYLTLTKEESKVPPDIVDQISQAESHLTSAEAFLAKNPSPDMKSAVGELNQSLTMAFWAHERVNLEQAKYDIEKYRKGDGKIQVVDINGKPLSGYTIAFQQASSDFLFGANPMGSDGSYDKTYADLMQQAGINYTCITSRWGRIEPVPGEFNWDNIDNFQNLEAQMADGFRLTGSLCLWLYRNASVGNDFCPTYLDNMTFAQLKDAVYSHVHSLASRYTGKIDTWEMNELNLPWANALNNTLEERVELAETFAKAVKDANPNGKVLMNSSALPFEYNISDYYTFDDVPTPYFIDLLKLRKVPLDIIGLEFYYSGITQSNTIPTVLDMALISNLLDQYNQDGLPIYIEELSAPSVQTAGSGWWHSNWSQDTQAEYLTDFYTLAFSKPMVHAINWSWGVSDRESFMAYGGLLDSNLKPKKSYYALEYLINSWKTYGAGSTNSMGDFNFRGFGGDYAVTITGPDGKEVKTNLHITEQQSQSTTAVFK
ncbi:MAG: carboxypeptidase regulatory-like domain-containing protein [Dehalococcoidia bacterium]